jgi:hypothetical protein
VFVFAIKEKKKTKDTNKYSIQLLLTFVGAVVGLKVGACVGTRVAPVQAKSKDGLSGNVEFQRSLPTLQGTKQLGKLEAE